MLIYKPPIRDLAFLLNDLLVVPDIIDDRSIGRDDIVAILKAAGRFACDRLLPLNASGDLEGCMLRDGRVTTPRGFPAAYRDYVADGWACLTLPPRLGGQGLPYSVGIAVYEMIQSANLSFADYLSSADGARLIDTHGTPALRARYLDNVAAGRWAITQCMTEPQAGSDLGLIATRAVPANDGSFQITGRKVFISGGDQDLTDNIIHFVLARLPDAAEGSRGLSLFLVPKFPVDDGGQLCSRNQVRVARIEHKMGYAGSATCEMLFEGAAGWLLGEPHRGLTAMFEMVGPVRLVVGQQGVAQAELAYQNAVVYAVQRRQGRAPGSETRPGSSDAIINHADVRRMLMSSRALTEAGRALILWVASEMDRCERTVSNPIEAAAIESRIALFIPVVKAACSDFGFESAIMCMDVFGGYGYVRDTGIEQIVRDVRVSQIHEGSNGINASDLVGRQLMSQSGVGYRWFIQELDATANRLALLPALTEAATALRKGTAELTGVSDWLIARIGEDRREAGAAGADFLRLFALVTYGWIWGRLAERAAPLAATSNFHAAKLVTARFFFARLLPLASGRAAAIRSGSAAVRDVPKDYFLSEE